MAELVGASHLAHNSMLMGVFEEFDELSRQCSAYSKPSAAEVEPWCRGVFQAGKEPITQSVGGSARGLHEETFDLASDK